LELRRARRALWAFRLVFYPSAVLVAVLALASRSDGDVHTWLDGTTSQGMSFELRIDGDGRPVGVGTAFKTQCPGGIYTVRWWPRGPFRLDDGALRIRETTTHQYDFYDQTSRRIVTLDARVDDGAVRGTATVVEHFDGPYWGRYLCESGPVTFSAG
jgi:hypothetical protein